MCIYVCICIYAPNIYREIYIWGVYRGTLIGVCIYIDTPPYNHIYISLYLMGIYIFIGVCMCIYMYVFAYTPQYIYIERDIYGEYIGVYL